MVPRWALLLHGCTRAHSCASTAARVKSDKAELGDGAALGREMCSTRTRLKVTVNEMRGCSNKLHWVTGAWHDTRWASLFHRQLKLSVLFVRAIQRVEGAGTISSASPVYATAAVVSPGAPRRPGLRSERAFVPTYEPAGATPTLAATHHLTLRSLRCNSGTHHGMSAFDQMFTNRPLLSTSVSSSVSSSIRSAVSSGVRSCG